MKNKLIFASATLLFFFSFKAKAVDPSQLDLMRQSIATNMDEVLLSTGLGNIASGGQCEMRSPYAEGVNDKTWGYANPQVLGWFSNYKEDPSVCALKFSDGIHYKLRTFSSKQEAEASGFMVTHYKACGACSSLSDLAIYLTKDLTTPARKCSSKFIQSRIENCYVREVGLSPLCAKAWTYNSQNTRNFCLKVCLKDYGLLNVLMGKFPANNLPDGSLRPCIECDERMSGAGFKRAAGRTRRNSGIISEIQRDGGEIEKIDHDHYFRR